MLFPWKKYLFENYKFCFRKLLFRDKLFFWKLLILCVTSVGGTRDCITWQNIFFWKLLILFLKNVFFRVFCVPEPLTMHRFPASSVQAYCAKTLNDIHFCSATWLAASNVLAIAYFLDWLADHKWLRDACNGMKRHIQYRSFSPSRDFWRRIVAAYPGLL